MKIVLFFSFLCAGIAACGQRPAGPSPAGQGVFIGSLPCGPQMKTFLGLQPNDSLCQLAKWRLTLEAGTYSLEVAHGFWVDNQTYRTMVTRTITGSWEPAPDTAGPRLLAITAPGGPPLRFLQVDANLLHLTDGGKRLLTSPPDFTGYNYTLTREQPLPPGPAYAVFPPRQPDTAVVSTFEGRTPCRELLAAAGVEPNPACTKLKWQLILHRQPQTGEPAYYEVSNTLNGHVLKRGNWRIIPGRTGLIYRLEGPYSLYLLRGDDDVLFFADAEHRLLPGNAHFGYTLGRVP